MGRHRKSDNPKEYQAEENILPESPNMPTSDIDYGYPLNIIESAASEGLKELKENFGDFDDDNEGFRKIEALEAVKFYILHPGATTRQFQSHFLAKKLKTGWKYGEDIDTSSLYHPYLLPFEELIEKQRESLAIFKTAALGALERYSNNANFGE